MLRRAYNGDKSAFELLKRLNELRVMAEHKYILQALYGEERYWGEVFEIIGMLEPADRLLSYAEMYRYDRSVHDDLLDSLISFKQEMIRDGAPMEFINAVNSIISHLSNPETVYREVKHLYAMYQQWKQMGEDFNVSTIGTFGTGAPSAQVTDIELARALNLIISMVSSGSRVRSADIKRFFGSDTLGAKVLRELKRRRLAYYDSNLSTYMPTDKGLEFVSADITLEELKTQFSTGEGE